MPPPLRYHIMCRCNYNDGRLVTQELSRSRSPLSPERESAGGRMEGELCGVVRRLQGETDGAPVPMELQSVGSLRMVRLL
jgi:hypothetical protein